MGNIHMSKTELAELAESTSNAYSFDRYRSWPAVIRILAKRGLSAREIEAVVRSKWMRWAGDMVEGTKGQTYGNIAASAIILFLDKYATTMCSPEKLSALVFETFTGQE